MVNKEKETDQSILSFHREVSFPRFPHNEFKQRLAKVKDLMGKYGIDALLLFSPDNLYYYTGFKKENLAMEKRWRRGAVIPKDGDPVMLMGRDSFINATLTSWVEYIRGWGGPPKFSRDLNFIEAYIQLIKELDLHRKVLGMELWLDSPAIHVDLSYLEFDQLRKAFPDAEIVDAGDLIWEQRMVKTSFEIGIIRELASIVNKGFKAGLEAVREGVTEKDIARKIYRVMIAEGLNNEPMKARMAMKGPGHYHAGIMGPQDTILKKGDMLMFDGGACHKGYFMDVQRNACVGEAPPLERKLYDMALAGQQAAISIIKPGIRAGDIHRAATEKMLSIDPKIDINRNVFVGHAIGLNTHEPPYLVPSGKQAEIVLKEGMYLTVEVSAVDAPEFRVVGGFPEDDILVTKDGYENFNEDIPNHLWIG